MTKGQKWGFAIGGLVLIGGIVTLAIFLMKEKKKSAELKTLPAEIPVPTVSEVATAAAVAEVTEAAAARKVGARFSATA